MKRYILAAMAFIGFAANAQNTYDAVRIFDSELTGTARFVGMGGSMGALGSDISVLSTNPAGIGLFRSSALSVSAGLAFDDNEADCRGTVRNEDKTLFSIENIGAVLTCPLFEDETLRYWNFAINYKHRKNLKREFSMAGATDGFSQMYQMQAFYNAAPFDILQMSYHDYTSLKYPWMALLGADGGLLYEGYEDAQGAIIDQGMPNYESTDMVYHSVEDGGVEQVEANLSFNINDRVYLGVTLSGHYVDYSRYSYYGEDDAFGEIYTLHNWYETRGEGFDAKFGVIVRPFIESSFRIGAAIHTPTWYSLTNRTSALIEGQPTDFVTGVMDTRDYDYAYGDDCYIDYHLSTPWRFNLSAAYTFDTFLALNAEYEYADYSTAKLKYDSGGDYIPGMKEEFKSNMKGVHTFKIGAEIRLDDNLSMRCGYNHISAPFKKDACKLKFTNVDTNTEYLNSYATNNYTLGMGYSSGNFYIDAAYLLSQRDADFYPFFDSYTDEATGRYNRNAPATVTENRHKLVLTAGLRF